MRSVQIELPAFKTEERIEIDIRINGQTRRYQYRIEILPWQDCVEPENRAMCISETVRHYDPEWQLFQIGNPTRENVPLMFRKRIRKPLN